jgi:hypothetical protein
MTSVPNRYRAGVAATGLSFCFGASHIADQSQSVIVRRPSPVTSASFTSRDPESIQVSLTVLGLSKQPASPRARDSTEDACRAADSRIRPPGAQKRTEDAQPCPVMARKVARIVFAEPPWRAPGRRVSERCSRRARAPEHCRPLISSEMIFNADKTPCQLFQAP